MVVTGSGSSVFAQNASASDPVAAKNEPKAATKIDPAEVARLIESLEARIKSLEEKLASRNSSDPVKSDPKPEEIAGMKKDVESMKEQNKKNDSFNGFFQKVEVSGIVDGYYSFNSNRVDMFTQGRAFDVRHNAMELQLAKLTVERKNSKESPLGFRVDLGLGETVDRIISVSDSSRNDATKHVLQAYASYVAPIGSGLTLDFGKMYTPVGGEVIETKDNFNYSRGLLFAYGPYYHTGLRAKYGINDKLSVSGFLFNGWDNLFENNVGRTSGKTAGFQVSYAPVKKLSLTQTYLAGPEAPLANVPALSARDNWRHIADTVATVYLTDKLTAMGNFVYGSDGDNDGKRGYWNGFAGYLKYSFNNRFAFSPRFEVLNDKKGLRTGLAQTIKEITLTQEMKLVNNFITRIEYRHDFSNRTFFTDYLGSQKKNEHTFIIGLSYFFSTREP
ncbi:MAG: porin [Acidobacteria bacterium]|nr:porin [Acidobacteriota bacterium]